MSKFESVTIGGQTYQIPTKEPKVKPDTYTRLTGLLLRGSGVAILAAVVWSTVSIGALLDRTAPAFFAYAIALMFDMAWVMCLIAEHIMRYDSWQRQLVPKAVGWLALLISMAAIYEHSALDGAAEVGMVGAAVSLVAKCMYWLTMFATKRKLDPATRAAMTLALNRVYADGAVAEAETRLAQVPGSGAQIRLSSGSLSPAQAQLTEPSPVGAYEPLSPPVEPVSRTEPKYPESVSPQLKKAEAVSKVLDMFTSNPGLTSGQVADTLGVSAATAKRYLREARGPYA